MLLQSQWYRVVLDYIIYDEDNNDRLQQAADSYHNVIQ